MREMSDGFVICLGLAELGLGVFRCKGQDGRCWRLKWDLFLFFIGLETMWRASLGCSLAYMDF